MLVVRELSCSGVVFVVDIRGSGGIVAVVVVVVEFDAVVIDDRLGVGG